MVEEFREIKECPVYSVSNFGKVVITETKYPLSLQETVKGYYQINLSLNSFGTKQVHRLIAKEFLPNPDNKQYVDHIDGNRLNNNLLNLRWATPQENAYNKKVKNKYGASGITYNEFFKRYVATIGYNKKSIILGYFKNVDDAVKSRKDAETKYYKEFKPKTEEEILEEQFQQLIK